MKPLVFFSAANNEMTAYHQALMVKLNELAGAVRGETGIADLRLDFNFGLRLEVPEGDYFIRISDSESGRLYFAGQVSSQCLISMEKYYIPWQVEVIRSGELVFAHQLDVTGQLVYLHLGDALGDMLAVMPYVLAFQKRYRCRIVCQWQENFSSLFAACFPHIPMVRAFPAECYAAFVLGIFQDAPILSPVDARSVPLPQMGGILLNLPVNPPKLRLSAAKLLPDVPQTPYVCIAAQATGVKKCWHYPQGWDILTAKLQEGGYRVLCIDGNRELRQGEYAVRIPKGAEDFTGRRPLVERLALLEGAACFIGVSSGLAWLAQAAGTPVVLISGFTLPGNEFFTPYRVINYQVCHGCHNDLRVDGRSLCPYHQGTVRELECSREITAAQVWRAVQRCLQETGQML